MHIQNRKAYYEYYIIEEYNAGMCLVGSEVKSIRNSEASISEAFVYISNSEIFIKGMFINKYKQAVHNNHEEVRDRKLLLNKKEICRIAEQLQIPGYTCIPLFLKDVNGKIKITIAVAKGKKLWDKKESIREKDIKLQTQRELNKY
ncbi:SsrA-binding protein SmpB [bacterium]|jgi:SsrA-binding protein|nr:SsrA-binding protein SmpB [bacterium]